MVLDIKMQNLNCFKAYDIRGKIGEELNDDIAYRIGRAYGESIKPKTVVIGGDARSTTESLKLALSKGLQDSGCHVWDIGLSGTEEIYFATFHLKVDGGIEITASHNPADYNGMKLVRKNSQPISNDSGLLEIKYLAEKNMFPTPSSEKIGSYTKISIIDDYVDHLISYINPSKFTPLKLVINSGNGAAGHIIDALELRFEKFGMPVKIYKINNNPDPLFPNGIPNPMLPECRKDTAEAVLHYSADLGIAFDGDFDRCFFFNHKGEFIDGYYIVGLLAEIFLKREKQAKIIHDTRLYWNTKDIINSFDSTAIMSKTGHAFIKERMRKENAIYGGEMSSHHYFRDFSFCDSGMIPWLLISELLCTKKKTLDELIKERITLYPSSGEINILLNNPSSAMYIIKELYFPDCINHDLIDGLSMEFSMWRFNLRVSNTEPLIRLNVETKGDINLLQEKTLDLLNILKSFQ